jgi:hypothetical protein
MKASIDGDPFGRILAKLIKDAGQISITTIAGVDFRVYEPIHIGHDYVSFKTSDRGNVTTVIRREAIASVTVQSNQDVTATQVSILPNANRPSLSLS